MLILEPDITVCWDEGVSLKARGLLFIEGTKDTTLNDQDADMTIYVTISGTEEPNVLITCSDGYTWINGTSNRMLRYIPGTIDVVNAWIDEHKLLAKWREEVAKYNTIMGQVDLPYADIERSDRKARYVLRTGVLGVLPVVVIVEVGSINPQAWVRLQLDTGETDDCNPVLCTISSYYLDFPITMDTLKASMCKPFQQYLDYLQA
ncbi:hypothetical protein [Microcoleus phage My-WqHQDG]|nr:hypothetical protein [Microcoleus phage My-WqHQDG]